MLNKQMSIGYFRMNVLCDIDAFVSVLLTFYAGVLLIFNAETQSH
jgi:hypothetical protein